MTLSSVVHQINDKEYGCGEFHIMSLLKLRQQGLKALQEVTEEQIVLKAARITFMCCFFAVVMFIF